MATAIASSHIRRRRASPKFTTSLIAPIVQKLTRVATAPNTVASRNARPVTSAGKWLTSFMDKLWHAGVRPGSPVEQASVACTAASG